MVATVVRCEWDNLKAMSKLAKHGVTFEEACTALDDPGAVTAVDVEHSTEEAREVTYGHAPAGHLLVIVHARRGDHNRIISARHAGRRGRRRYGALQGGVLP